ncbi:MAG: ABC transporter ATP-binding protein [Dehalococcoidia bacterium]|nr:ABC transporter ATP-binding protein [Dehalococcoidia bacterium]
MPSSPIIETRKLSKVYFMGTVQVYALKEVSLIVERGEFVAVMGPSGSGKSTLLNLLGCLDRPSGGSYILDGQDVAGLRDNGLARIRNNHIGFIFQTFNLLPRLSAQRNVELPLLYSRNRKDTVGQRARELLERVGVEERARHRPTEMSGGQQQRVAIARALVNDPAIILADEPTGNLDSATGREIIALLREVAKEGRTLIMVTHDRAIGEQADRILWMCDGELSSGEAWV